ncbi:phospholipase [Erwinia sp. HDF1-3R]|uniref:phospholipase n=2 Tax=unclassified Erwinia TaxID=2622719 RepID=UPI0031F4C7CA
MSFIEDVKVKLNALGLFNSETTLPNYIRLIDTPHIFGLPFNQQIMDQSIKRKDDFERSMEEIIQKAVYRCDVTSLHSPDPEWGKVILRSMDVCLSQKMGRTHPVQFRFLFGNTPYNLLFPADDLIDFQASLLRLVRDRSQDWEIDPEIYIGIFSRIGAGVISALTSKLISDEILDSEDNTKMTWNHVKVIAIDGSETLAGGHNLKMDLLTSYPPVHDISAVIHGQAALGSQLYLNELWSCGRDLLSKNFLDTNKLSWRDVTSSQIADPLAQGTKGYHTLQQRWDYLIKLHQNFTVHDNLTGDVSYRKDANVDDFKAPLFELPQPYTTYTNINEYRLADRVLCLGKYWTGPNNDDDFKIGAEVMKETLIKGAKKIIRMSQQDLISAWKNNWKEHHVCIWLIEALLANPELEVQVIVSPLDASAGSSGDQYSFGSGSQRTMDLFRYYMTHDVETDKLIPDPDAKIASALTRIKIAPLYFTDKVDKNHQLEGVNYKWPDAPENSYTATLKRPPLTVQPPSKGNIGSSAMALIHASGFFYPKVTPAPGNHAKITIIDDELYLIGSDNMYPGYLSEIDFMIEGKQAVDELLKSYWHPIWKYSSQHAAK